MEDNRQDKDLKQAEKNTGTGEETSGKTSRKTRHTWIGDKDEIRPDGADRPVTRMTIPDAGARGTKMISTKVVERPKKPYRGFITDEEIRQRAAELGMVEEDRVLVSSPTPTATTTPTRGRTPPPAFRHTWVPAASRCYTSCI